MSPNLTGALLMMASMAAFTFNDAAIKATGGAIPLFQVIFLRGLLTCALIITLSRFLGRIHFQIAPRDWGVMALRTFAELCATYFFLSALFNMPLANLTAILQALPLTVTLAAALVFREAVGWRRMLAILIGFAGVLLIIKPGTQGFTIWSLYGVLAVICVTVRDLCSRRFSPQVPTMTVTLVTAGAITVAAGLASLGAPWESVSVTQGQQIALAAVFIFAGYFCSVQVMRVGDVSFVAPFRYTGLLWALLIGLWFFSEWPDVLTLIGAGIVVGTGVFTLYREGRAKRRV